jgi:hypothetical protein
MKTLQKCDINLVKPEFRKMVELAWAKGQKVPYGVIYLSDTTPTNEDISWANEAIKSNKFQD